MNLFLALLATAFAIFLLARYLPRTSIYRRFVLSADIPSGPSLAGTHREFHTPLEIAPGVAGKALTTLRPSGKARIADQVVDVVTEGEFIAAETAVEVVSSDGMRVVVRTAA